MNNWTYEICIECGEYKPIFYGQICDDCNFWKMNDDPQGYETELEDVLIKGK